VKVLLLQTRGAVDRMVSVAPISFEALVSNPPDLPEFQRGKVWSDTTKYELVLSTFLKYPIGALAICRSDEKDWLLDGQQRLDCINSMYSPFQVWSWFQSTMNISYQYTFFTEASDIKKKAHIEQSLKYLAYLWIADLEKEDQEIQAILDKMPSLKKHEKEDKAKKKSDERTKILKKIEIKEDHHYFDDWMDDKGVKQSPNAPTFLTLAKLFIAVEGIHTHKEVCQTTLERTLFGQYSAAKKESEYFKHDVFCEHEQFSTEKCSELLRDFAKLSVDHKTNEPKFISYFSSQMNVYFTGNGKQNWEKKFSPGSDELKDLMYRLQMLQEYYHFVNKAEVGKIIFEDLSDRTTTFLDQMKVFRLINAAGTELNEIDLIVVNPGWRKKENVSDTKFSDLQKMLNKSQEKLLLKGPSTPDTFEFDQIQRWQIACAFDYGFRELFPDSGLELIL
tara:strand:+ start:286 stop:1629 length:1344 start_codon:yes stop_codon:yes gene_type:complete